MPSQIKVTHLNTSWFAIPQSISKAVSSIMKCEFLYISVYRHIYVGFTAQPLNDNSVVKIKLRLYPLEKRPLGIYNPISRDVAIQLGTGINI